MDQNQCRPAIPRTLVPNWVAPPVPHTTSQTKSNMGNLEYHQSYHNLLIRSSSQGISIAIQQHKMKEKIENLGWISSHYQLSTSATALSSSSGGSSTEKSLRRECTAKNPCANLDREDRGNRWERPNWRNGAIVLLLPAGFEEGEKEPILRIVLLLQDNHSGGSSRLGSCRDGELVLAISAEQRRTRDTKSRGGYRDKEREGWWRILEGVNAWRWATWPCYRRGTADLPQPPEWTEWLFVLVIQRRGGENIFPYI